MRMGRQLPRRWMCLWAIVILALAGCQNTYQRLRSEDSVPEMAALKAAAQSEPLRTTYVPVGQYDGKQTRLAVYESGTGQRDRLVVFMHGALSNARTWRFVRGGLAGKTDVMLIDLLGCGQSDKPDPARVDERIYSPDRLARQVLTALRERLRHRDHPPRITLAAHCLGGTTALRMLSDEGLLREFDDVLSHVDTVVLFSPVDAGLEKPADTYARVGTISDLEVCLGLFLGVVREEASLSEFEGVSDPALAIREEADRTLEVFRDHAAVEAMQAMLRQAVPTFSTTPFRPDPSRIRELISHYQRILVPVLIVWGDGDTYNPLSNGYKLLAQLPDARLRILVNVKHSISLERPAIAATLIEEFIRLGGQAGPTVAIVDFSGGIEAAKSSLIAMKEKPAAMPALQSGPPKEFDGAER